MEIFDFQLSLTRQQGILSNQTELQMCGVYIEKMGLFGKDALLASY